MAVDTNIENELHVSSHRVYNDDEIIIMNSVWTLLLNSAGGWVRIETRLLELALAWHIVCGRRRGLNDEVLIFCQGRPEEEREEEEEERKRMTLMDDGEIR